MKVKEDRRLSSDAQQLMFAWLAKRGAVSDDTLTHLMDEAASTCEKMGLVGWESEPEPYGDPEESIIEIPFGATGIGDTE